MNDIELDEMLNQWGVPPAGAELRERVRSGFVAGPKRRRRYFPLIGWKGLFAGVAAATVLFLVVTAQAFPDFLGMASPALRPPYMAISSVVRYATDGSSTHGPEIFSYNYKGTEIIEQENVQGNPFMGVVLAFHLGVHRMLLEFAPNLVMPESSARDVAFSAYLKAGCVNDGDVVIGHETLLAHQTTVIQHVRGWRWTEWRAPDLGCFALRRRNEDLVAGGGYRLTEQRDTVRVLRRRADGRGWE